MSYKLQAAHVLSSVEAQDIYDALIASAEVLARLDSMFADSADRAADYVVLSSIHKAKGLERAHVWVLVDTFRPNGGQEEENLRYVAYTRTQSHLYLVSGVEVSE